MMLPLEPPDYAQLVSHAPTPDITARVKERAAKVAQMKNWYQFMQPFSKFFPTTGDHLTAHFRNGGELALRTDTQDIAILHEVFLQGAYGSLEKIAGSVEEPVNVIDLGAHIGCFTLRSLWSNPNIYVESYEPGDDNRSALLANIGLNRSIAPRVNVYADAVAGADGTALYFHDPKVTVDSSLYGASDGVAVPVVSLKTVLGRCKHPLLLLKIDIEGAEYDLLNGSSNEDWERVPNIVVETHPDPAGRSSPEDWLKAMYQLGFRKQTKEFSTVLLSRR